ncbi:TolC family protein [Bacteroidales bacterium]
MESNKTERNKRLSWSVFLAGLLLFAVSSGIFAQRVYTLEECIQLALENNIRIKQSRLDVENTDLSQLQSKLDLLPSLNAGSSHSIGWGRALDMATYKYVDKQTKSTYFNISSDLSLFSGFQKLNTIKQRRADYLAAKYSADKIQNDVSLTVAGAYLQILFSRELLNNARMQADITAQQMERTKKLVEAGTLAQGSFLDVQAQYANEEVAIVQYANQLNLAYLDLLQLLELKAGTPLEIEVPLLEVAPEAGLLPVDYIYNKALDFMPEIKSAEQQYLSSRHSLNIARGSRSPSLSLSAALGTSFSDQIRVSNNPLDGDFNKIKPFEDQWNDNRNATLSFRLNVPIFNAYQISSYIGKSRIGMMNADYNLQLSKNTLRKNVETAYADALSSHATFVARGKSLASLRESFHYTEQKFNVGMVNAIDYNLAKSQLAKSESELLSAKYDYLFKLKILDFYLGRPLSFNVKADK